MPTMIFEGKDGTQQQVDAPVGLSVLEIAHRHGVDIEGACEGSLACATCHVVVDEQWYDKVGAPAEDEEDMLDLASGVERTSRLGCQVVMSAGLDGLKVRVVEG